MKKTTNKEKDPGHLVTIKCPAVTHKKVKTIARVKDKTLIEMIDILAEGYIGNMKEDERKFYDFLSKQNKI